MTQLAAIPDHFEPLPGQPAVVGKRVALRCEGWRHYRIGPVPVSVRSEPGSVEADFHALYAAYEVDAPSGDGFHIDVVAHRSRRSLRRYYYILGNGEVLFAVRQKDEILPHVEWAINTLVARHLPGYLQIHASVISGDGIGLVLPGQPGQGKSTLAAGLLARGWSYLSDEFALIDPDTRLLNPYPKALCIKAGSFDALRQEGLPLDPGRVYYKGEKGRVVLLNPLRIRPGVVAGPCPIGMVVFPQFSRAVPAMIEPMSRAEAMFKLTGLCFNFGKLRTRGFDLLVEVVQNARCFKLRTGDLGQSCELIEACLRQTGPAED